MSIKNKQRNFGIKLRVLMSLFLIGHFLAILKCLLHWDIAGV